MLSEFTITVTIRQLLFSSRHSPLIATHEARRADRLPAASRSSRNCSTLYYGYRTVVLKLFLLTAQYYLLCKVEEHWTSKLETLQESQDSPMRDTEDDKFENIIYLSIRFYNSCRRLPETKRHSSLFLHWSVSKFLVVMSACTPSIHVFLGRPLFFFSPVVSIIL